MSSGKRNDVTTADGAPLPACRGAISSRALPPAPADWRSPAGRLAFGAGARDTDQDRLRQPAHRPARRFRRRRPYVLELARKALAKRTDRRRQDLRRRDHGSRHAIRSGARRPVGEGVDHQRQYRSDADRRRRRRWSIRSRTPARRRACHASRPSCRGRRGISAAAPSPAQPSPFKWTYHFCFGVDEFVECLRLAMERRCRPTRRSACCIPTTPTATRSAQHLAPALAKAGYTIVDPGGYEDGTTDYSAQIAKFKAEQCEIFNTFPIPPDFATFWRQAAQQGYTKMVKIAQIAKTGLFPSQIEALGSLGYNLAGACYWHPAFPYRSSLTGVSSKAAGRRLREDRRASSGTSSSAPRMSLLDVGFAALQGQRQPQGQGRRRQGVEHAQGHDRRSARSISPRGRCPMSRRRRSSAPVDQGKAGQQIQVRLRHHRERRRPERSGRLPSCMPYS